MATNLSAPVTEDIWHLSIDDLLSPLPEKPRLGGPGPFVINLSSSTAGIGLPTLNLAGCESAHAYEIQRNEDGRTRYRLRLGPFETEEAADLILSMVREIYPSALTATAGVDDLKSIATIRAKAAAAAEARKPPAPAKQPEPPVVVSRVDPIDAALKAIASRPSAAVAAKPQAPPMAAAPTPVAPSAIESITVGLDLSLAEILPPKRPEVPTVAVRAAPTFVEPPLVTERVEFTAMKKVSAPVLKDTVSPPVVMQRADVAVTKPPAAKVAAPPAKDAVAAPVAAAPAPKPINPTPIAAMPSLAPVVPPTVAAAAPKVVITANVPAPTPVAPSIVATSAPKAVVAAPAPARATVAPAPVSPVYVAPAAPSLPKQPASIWEPLPVAPRSVAPKFVAAAARPAMSVSAPLVRRPAAAAAAAAAVKPTAPALASLKPSTAQTAPATNVVKPPVAPKPATAMAASASVATTAAATTAAQKSAAQRPAAPMEKHLDFDSTQTMRALTPKELSDENALPWFVIELATSPEVFDPDSVPNLDIFAEYRLYSVAETATGRIVHSLRVGFFSAEIAAKAVASYLAEYYDKPAIKRVSFAERERFAEQVVEARKDVGATGRHAVIEITDDLVARRRRFSANAQPASPAP